MKIAHVMSYFQPALGYDDLHLSRAQCRKGHTVVVVAADRYRPFPDYERTVAGVLGPRYVGPGRRAEMDLDTWRLPAALEARTQVWLRGLADALAGVSPDVVHLHGSLTLLGVQTAATCERLRLPLVADNHHEPETFRDDEFARRIFFAAFRRWGAPRLRRGARAFVAINAASQQVFARELGLPPERIAVIPLGADAERFRHDRAGRERIRRRIGLPNSAVVVLYAGKVIPSKDVHVLAEAFALVAHGVPDLHLLLLGAGETDYCSQIEGALVRYADRVHWLPPVPNSELAALYSAADIGVWPSESSNAMIEAAAAGLPVVVADTPANSHRISNANGVGVQRGDVKAFASALSDLALDLERRREMGRRGRELVERELSWPVLAERWVALYESAAVG